MRSSRRTTPIVTLCSTLSLVLCGLLSAQERRQSGPPPHDVSREVTVRATVIPNYTMPAPGATDQDLSILAVTIDGKAVQGFWGLPAS